MYREKYEDFRFKLIPFWCLLKPFPIQKTFLRSGKSQSVTKLRPWLEQYRLIVELKWLPFRLTAYDVERCRIWTDLDTYDIPDDILKIESGEIEVEEIEHDKADDDNDENL